MSNKSKQVKKEYFKAKDSVAVKIRLNLREQILLQSMMQKDGWENVSGFIKYTLFGDDPDARYKKILHESSPEEIITLARTELRHINAFLSFINFRYDKDMKQLYREEGVDIKKWIAATEKPHSAAIALLKDVYTSFREIAFRFGIDISHESLAPEPEEHDYSDTKANDETAKKIYEQFQVNETKNLHIIK